MQLANANLRASEAFMVDDLVVLRWCFDKQTCVDGQRRLELAEFRRSVFHRLLANRPQSEILKYFN